MVFARATGALRTVALLGLLALHVSASYFLFEDSPKEERLHPRTFYLTSYQENELISRVFCEGYSCPYFTVVKDFPDYIQQRDYSAATFLFNTDRKVCDFLGTVQLAKVKLDAYRNGSNEREQVYAATLPLLIQVDVTNPRSSKTSRRNPWCLMSYTAGIYLPHYWGTFPKPDQGSLRFMQLKEGFQAYVHTYSGPTKNLLLKELDAFRQALDKQKLCYKPRRFYIAVYEIPGGKSRDIRNEIWMEKCSRMDIAQVQYQQ